MNKLFQRCLCIAIVLLTMPSMLCAQEMYTHKTNGYSVLFLGDSNDSGQLKVWENNKVTYIDTANLELSNVLTFPDMMKYIAHTKLYFSCEGEEPFWSLRLKGNQLAGTVNDKRITAQIRYSYLYTKGRDAGIMFSSKNNAVYGIIKRADMACNCLCGMLATESKMRYECFISVGGIAYKGCATISAD